MDPATDIKSGFGATAEGKLRGHSLVATFAVAGFVSNSKSYLRALQRSDVNVIII